MIREENFLQLEKLIESKDFPALNNILKEMNAVDTAEFIEELPIEKALLVFRMLNKDAALRAFSNFDDDMQQSIISAITDQETALLLKNLWMDDTVDMLEEMPAMLVKKVLRNSTPEARERINQYLNYPESSAGRVMTAEYIDLHKSLTVEDAIKCIRRVGEERETVYTCYVTDETRHLQGVVTVKDLLLAGDTQTVEEIMETGVISVTTTADREDTAKFLAKYNLFALPVVDAENRLVGIVTVDDAMDVLQEEDTEDFEKMAAMTPSEKPYLKTSVFALAKNRFPWLLILMLSNTITGFILGKYEAVYVMLPLLVTFVPMITGTGGNAGSQSSTLVIRGMALGEVRMKDFFAVVWKELRVCLVVGTLLAAVTYARVVVFNQGEVRLAITVALSLFGSVFIGKVMGSMLPMLAKACKIDPAVVAAPLITTIVDALALAVYFRLAMSVLHLP